MWDMEEGLLLGDDWMASWVTSPPPPTMDVKAPDHDLDDIPLFGEETLLGCFSEGMGGVGADMGGVGTAMGGVGGEGLGHTSWSQPLAWIENSCTRPSNNQPHYSGNTAEGQTLNLTLTGEGHVRSHTPEAHVRLPERRDDCSSCCTIPPTPDSVMTLTVHIDHPHTPHATPVTVLVPTALHESYETERIAQHHHPPSSQCLFPDLLSSSLSATPPSSSERCSQVVTSSFHNQSEIATSQFHNQSEITAGQFHGQSEITTSQFHNQSEITAGQFRGQSEITAGQFHGQSEITAGQFHGQSEITAGQFHAQSEITAGQFHGQSEITAGQFHGQSEITAGQFHAQSDVSAGQFHGQSEITAGQFHGQSEITAGQFHGQSEITAGQLHAQSEIATGQFHAQSEITTSQFHGQSEITAGQFHGQSEVSAGQFHAQRLLDQLWGCDLQTDQGMDVVASLEAEWAEANLAKGALAVLENCVACPEMEAAQLTETGHAEEVGVGMVKDPSKDHPTPFQEKPSGCLILDDLDFLADLDNVELGSLEKTGCVRCDQSECVGCVFGQSEKSGSVYNQSEKTGYVCDHSEKTDLSDYVCDHSKKSSYVWGQSDKTGYTCDQSDALAFSSRIIADHVETSPPESCSPCRHNAHGARPSTDSALQNSMLSSKVSVLPHGETCPDSRTVSCAENSVDRALTESTAENTDNSLMPEQVDSPLKTPVESSRKRKVMKRKAKNPTESQIAGLFPPRLGPGRPWEGEALQTPLNLHQFRQKVFLYPFDKENSHRTREPKTADKITNIAVLIESETQSRNVSEKIKRMHASQAVGKLKTRQGEFYCPPDYLRKKTVRQMLLETRRQKRAEKKRSKQTTRESFLEEEDEESIGNLSSSILRTKNPWRVTGKETREKRKAEDIVNHDEPPYQKTKLCRRAGTAENITGDAELALSPESCHSENSGLRMLQNKDVELVEVSDTSTDDDLIFVEEALMVGGIPETNELEGFEPSESSLLNDSAGNRVDRVERADSSGGPVKTSVETEDADVSLCDGNVSEEADSLDGRYGENGSEKEGSMEDNFDEENTLQGMERQEDASPSKKKQCLAISPCQSRTSKGCDDANNEHFSSSRKDWSERDGSDTIDETAEENPSRRHSCCSENDISGTEQFGVGLKRAELNRNSAARDQVVVGKAAENSLPRKTDHDWSLQTVHDEDTTIIYQSYSVKGNSSELEQTDGEENERCSVETVPTGHEVRQGDVKSLPVVEKDGRFISCDAIYNGEIEALYRTPFMLVVHQPVNPSTTVCGKHQENGVQDSDAQENGAQENSTQEGDNQENGTQENVTQEIGTWENGTQERDAQEIGTQENGTQENSTQENGAQENGTQNSTQENSNSDEQSQNRMSVFTVDKSQFEEGINRESLHLFEDWVIKSEKRDSFFSETASAVAPENLWTTGGSQHTAIDHETSQSMEVLQVSDLSGTACLALLPDGTWAVLEREFVNAVESMQHPTEPLLCHEQGWSLSDQQKCAGVGRITDLQQNAGVGKMCSVQQSAGVGLLTPPELLSKNCFMFGSPSSMDQLTPTLPFVKVENLNPFDTDQIIFPGDVQQSTSQSFEDGLQTAVSEALSCGELHTSQAFPLLKTSPENSSQSFTPPTKLVKMKETQGEVFSMHTEGLDTLVRQMAGFVDSSSQMWPADSSAQFGQCPVWEPQPSSVTCPLRAEDSGQQTQSGPGPDTHSVDSDSSFEALLHILDVGRCCGNSNPPSYVNSISVQGGDSLTTLPVVTAGVISPHCLRELLQPTSSGLAAAAAGWTTPVPFSTLSVDKSVPSASSCQLGKTVLTSSLPDVPLCAVTAANTVSPPSSAVATSETFLDGSARNKAAGFFNPSLVLPHHYSSAVNVEFPHALVNEEKLSLTISDSALREVPGETADDATASSFQNRWDCTWRGTSVDGRNVCPVGTASTIQKDEPGVESLPSWSSQISCGAEAMEFSTINMSAISAEAFLEDHCRASGLKHTQKPKSERSSEQVRSRSEEKCAGSSEESCLGVHLECSVSSQPELPSQHDRSESSEPECICTKDESKLSELVISRSESSKQTLLKPKQNRSKSRQQSLSKSKSRNVKDTADGAAAVVGTVHNSESATSEGSVLVSHSQSSSQDVTQGVGCVVSSSRLPKRRSSRSSASLAGCKHHSTICKAGLSPLKLPSSLPPLVMSSDHFLPLTLSSTSLTMTKTYPLKYAVTPVTGNKYHPCPCHPLSVDLGGSGGEGLPCIPFSPSFLTCPTMTSMPSVAACPSDLPQNPCRLREGVYEYSPRAADIHAVQSLYSKSCGRPPDHVYKDCSARFFIHMVCIGDFTCSVDNQKYGKNSRICFSFMKRLILYKLELVPPVSEKSSQEVVTTEIDMQSIVGLWGADNKLLLELSEPPHMYLGKKWCRKTRQPIDITGGQMRKVPYHFMTFQSGCVRTLKRYLCEHPFFCHLLVRPVTVDLRKTFPSPHTGDGENGDGSGSPSSIAGPDMPCRENVEETGNENMQVCEQSPQCSSSVGNNPGDADCGETPPPDLHHTGISLNPNETSSASHADTAEASLESNSTDIIVETKSGKNLDSLEPNSDRNIDSVETSSGKNLESVETHSGKELGFF
ncbi:hypothetical protein ACOMHN_020778 [Nucella lapillus]